MARAARLRLFGDFALEDGDGQPIALTLRKAEALIAYLALAPGQSSSREKLAALLWGDSDQARARQSLRQAIFALSRAFAQRDLSLLRLESQSVRLAPDALEVDAVEFERLVAEGSKANLALGCALYRGELLSGFSIEEPEFEHWLTATRQVYQDTALRALVDLLQEQEKAGELDPAIETASKALRIEPYREDIHRQLMRVYAANGMRSSALSQYRACRDILGKELGVRPDEETTGLYHQILEQGGDTRPSRPGERTPAATPGPAERASDGLGRLVAAPDGVSVGRQPEIEQLTRLVERVRADGCLVAFVTGEDGIGKTHLIDRFGYQAAADGTVLARMRAYKTNAGIRLGFWSDGIAELLAQDAAGLADLPAPFRGRLERLTTDAPLPGADVDDSGDGGDLRDLAGSLAQLMRRLAADKGLVILCDDLHWADDHSLLLLFQLVRQLGSSPVLFVCSQSTRDMRQRMALRDLAQDLESSGRLARLVLAPLGREESLELAWRLQQALGIKRDSKSRLNRIWQLSEGNPRMICESVLAGADSDGSGQPGEISLPRALLDEVALIQNRLGPRARELLALAGAMGNRADYPVIVRASGMTETEAAQAMEELAAENVLSVSGHEAAFVHKRVAHAVREDLLPPRRKLLHAAVARAIEEVHAEEIEPHYLSLADHLRGAGDALRSLDCELKAARVEISRGLPASARRLFQRVLDSARRLPRSEQVTSCEIDAHLGLAELAEAEEDRTRALVALDRAEALVGPQGDTARRARLAMARARLLHVSGEVDESYRLARQALADAERIDPSLLWLPGEHLIGHLHLIGGSIGRVIDRMSRRQARCADLDLREDAAEAAAILGLLYGMQGRFGEAERWSADAVRLAESIANEAYMAACLQASGVVRSWRGDVQSALEAFHRALDIARARGDVLRLYSLTGHKGFALLSAGDAEQAVGELEAALGQGIRLGARLFQPLFKAWLAEASIGIRSDEEVIRLAREALRLAADCNQSWARSVAHRALARLLSRPGCRDLNVADRAIRTAVAAQGSLGLPFEAARSLVVHAKILRARGNARRSSEIFAEAGEIFEKMGLAADFDRARTMAEALRPAAAGTS